MDPKSFYEVYVQVDVGIVAGDDEPVVNPAETVLDANADGEVLVADLVNIQESHGEVDGQRSVSRTPSVRSLD